MVPIAIPPLRERKEDILPLAYHTLERLNAQARPGQTVVPGDVRPAGAVRMAGQRPRTHQRPGTDADPERRRHPHPVGAPAYFNYRRDQGEACHDGANNLRDAMCNLEQSMIKCALRKHGSLRPASKELGISHPTLLRKIRKYGIVVQE